MTRCLTISLLTCTLLLGACAHRLAPAPLSEADAAMQTMIDKQQMPGGVLWIEQQGASHHAAFGQRAVAPQAEVLSEDTLFDVASLTKPIVTASLVQILRERGRLDIEAPLLRYLPECADGELAHITLRQLLTHSSALPSGISAASGWTGIDGALRTACGLKLQGTPGAVFRYSDVNFILLGIIVARTGGEPLEQLAQHLLFEPMGMRDSGYLPLQRFSASRIAPTSREGEGGSFLRGVVHDPTARRMGGVAGHAGLFTTSADLARFARMLLNGGVSEDGKRILSTESVALLTTPQSPPGIAVRGLGWDIDSPYSRPRGKGYPKTSFGHTGFTGCAFWLDPTSHSFFVLLANRVHPGGPTNTLPLYEQLGTAAAAAAGVQRNE
ncbi:MAG TPA: serine hydrolase domain-containing protein [Burkholderiaceae bacterium]